METIAILDPLSGNALHEIPAFSAEDVAAAVLNARAAQPSWAKTEVRQRVTIAKRLAKLVSDRQGELMDTLQLETGKSRNHAFEEITGGLAAISYYSNTAPKLLSRKSVRSAVPVLIKTFVEPAPIGVVGVITPWNYPIALTLMDVIPALLAGNAVVQKADNQTALSTHMLRDLAVEAGLNPQLWTVVQGEPSIVGNAVTDNVDYVAFTGSTATGRLVAERAAKRLIGYSLELGGKNPMIIMPGADLRHAAKVAISSAFGNAGQLCVSIERIYVPKFALQEFEQELKAEVAELKIGSSREFEHDLGSLTSKAQVDRVAGFVERALMEGARLLTGGERLEHLGPHFYAPTVLTDVPEHAEILTKEVFGPVIALVGYSSLEEAVELANKTEYGLNASIVGDASQALKVAGELMAGSVNINEGYRATMSSMSAPMGGMKQSGMGRRSGPGGLLRYTENRTIAVARKLPIGLPNRAHEYKRMAPLMTKMVKMIGKF